MLHLDKFTIKAQETLSETQNIAKQKNHGEINDIHLLHSLLTIKDTAILPILQKIGAPIDNINKLVNIQLKKLPVVKGNSQQYLSNKLNTIFENAQSEATSLNDEYTSCEHILLSLLKSNTDAATILKDNRVTIQDVLKALDDVRGGSKVDSADPESKFQALEKYTINLTKRAQDGKLDPVIGRDDEIRRVIQILCRRTKNNPVLIGEPGVGKTAIAEGLAQRIISGDIPELLKNKQLLTLDLGTLIAGAKFRGEFEDRLKAVLKEISKSNGEIILFIDELHTLVGAGASEGAMDAANMLKPALARGELRCIGATTLNEYKKYIEKDSALERRFQQTYIGEPNVNDTIAILRGLKEKYEIHHGIKILDSALVAAANLSHRYIADRFLPDKAIDLMDEASSKRRIEIDSMPEEIDEIERKIIQIKIEKQALKNDTDIQAKNRFEKLSKELAELEDKSKQLKTHWQNEKKIISEIQELKSNLEQLKNEEQVEERRGNYERVSEIRFKETLEVNKKIEDLSSKLVSIQKDNKMLKEEIDDQDICDIISKWTGIPVTKLLKSDKDRLLNTEGELKKRVIGQTDAIEKLANAVRRSRAGISDPNKPYGAFLFLGPTGVGKTELSKALAEFLFDSEKNMIRIDMSEYMEKHSVSRLIGAPPGYIGHDEGGQLTEAVRRRPYSVILLDEVEKAHPDVFNILLQILDDGRLTDSKGRTVDFKNTIIVMTSNIGSAEILKSKNKDDIQEIIQDQLKNYFRPEFLNRLDDTIIFGALTEDDILNIIDVLIEKLNNRLKDKDLHIKLSQKAKKFLTTVGYSPDFGARPLKRSITNYIENPLAIALLKGNFDNLKDIYVDVKNDTLVLEKETVKQ